MIVKDVEELYHREMFESIQKLRVGCYVRLRWLFSLPCKGGRQTCMYALCEKHSPLDEDFSMLFLWNYL